MSERPVMCTHEEMKRLAPSVLVKPKVTLLYLGRYDAMYSRTGDMWFLLDPTEDERART